MSAAAQAASAPESRGQISPLPSAFAPIAAGSAPAIRDRAVKRKFAEHAIALDGVRSDGADCRHQPERDGKIVVAAFLRLVGRGEVDGDALWRKRQADGISAPRTRSRLSPTALSGRPTTMKAGNPGPICTCTSMGRASMPSKATVVTRANIA